MHFNQEEPRSKGKVASMSADALKTGNKDVSGHVTIVPLMWLTVAGSCSMQALGAIPAHRA